VRAESYTLTIAHGRGRVLRFPWLHETRTGAEGVRELIILLSFCISRSHVFVFFLTVTVTATALLAICGGTTNTRVSIHKSHTCSVAVRITVKVILVPVLHVFVGGAVHERGYGVLFGLKRCRWSYGVSTLRRKQSPLILDAGIACSSRQGLIVGHKPAILQIHL
jgi:hypothetical protein